MAAEKSHRLENLPPINISPNLAVYCTCLQNLRMQKKFLKVGTLAGYSTIWMARSLPKDGKLITLEKDNRIMQMWPGKI